MSRIIRAFLIAVLLAGPAAAADEAASTGLAQLRHVVGNWSVTTEFLRPDGSVARAVAGTYRFDWAEPDHSLVGASTIPELGMTAAILFYLRPATSEIEMVSVGKDGKLWVMTGPIDGETRTTPDYANPDGTRTKLRFTRYNVSDDRFESKMEYSADGGQTWTRGNHQLFVRSAS